MNKGRGGIPGCFYHLFFWFYMGCCIQEPEQQPSENVPPHKTSSRKNSAAESGAIGQVIHEQRKHVRSVQEPWGRKAPLGTWGVLFTAKNISTLLKCTLNRSLEYIPPPQDYQQMKKVAVSVVILLRDFHFEVVFLHFQNNLRGKRPSAPSHPSVLP